MVNAICSGPLGNKLFSGILPLLVLLAGFSLSSAAATEKPSLQIKVQNSLGQNSVQKNIIRSNTADRQLSLTAGQLEKKKSHKQPAQNKSLQTLKIASDSISPLVSRQDPGYIYAMAYVQSTQIYRGLSLMLLDQVKENPLVLEAIERDGFDSVQNTVVDEIKQVSVQYRSRWNNSLARLLSQHLSVDTLADLARNGQASLYVKKIVSLNSQPSIQHSLKTSALFKQAEQSLMHRLKTSLSAQAIPSKNP